MQCPKCNGLGVIREYGHIANGVCFHCKGSGMVAKSGRTPKSVKLSDIALILAGTTRRETKLIIDCVLAGSEIISDSTVDLEKLVKLGYMVKRESTIWCGGKKSYQISYLPALYFTAKSIRILLDAKAN